MRYDRVQITTEEILNKIENKGKDEILTVQISPAVRVSIGEYLGFEPGTNLIGKLIGALRQLGFDYVFDTNFGADLTVVEEAAELVRRLKGEGELPMFSTCCPTWYRFVETSYPDLIEYLSTTKSPQAMLGSLVKTHFIEKQKIELEKIKHYVIAPCIIKKHEAENKDLWVHKDKDIPNIDLVITTKELAEVIKKAGIDFASIEESDFDNPLGLASGAGAIFGTTGGVMEAVLRTAHFYLEGKDPEVYEFEEVRSTALRREGRVKLSTFDIDIAAVNSIKEAKVLLDEIRDKGKSSFEFVEVMACPMGCIGGAGQSTPDKEVLEKRREALFKYDKEHKFRSAHNNEYIKKLYKDFLGEVGGKKAREFLHTKYLDKSIETGEDLVCKLE